MSEREGKSEAGSGGVRVDAPVRRVQAGWCVELNCECPNPNCGEWVNLLDEVDFWDGRTLEIAEDRKGLEVVCPKCGHEFEVDCVF